MEQVKKGDGNNKLDFNWDEESEAENDGILKLPSIHGDDEDEDLSEN